MLNEKNERELAYVVKIDDIKPIIGSDNCECAVVGGWEVMVRKGAFKVNDLAVYFEIDSHLDTTLPVFAFLKNKHGNIKPQKYTFGGKGKFISQGLLMSFNDFNWNSDTHKLGDFLTTELGVTYAMPDDNIRKSKSPDKYKVMMQRKQNLFKHKWAKWIMRYKFGRKIMFALFGRKKDNNEWPSHIARKTDVERIQNMIYVLNDKQPYVATEKVDGYSCSMMAEKKKFGKIKYYVCSRNVVFKSENQQCFYETNCYFEVYNKYNVQNILKQILKDYNLSNVAIQAEVYGKGIQKREYSTDIHKMAVFHIVSNGIKFPMDKTIEICERYGLPHVPIIDDNYILPNTVEELQTFVEGAPSKIDGLPKEGIVFYDKKTGQQYFKFVSPEFLMMYH